MIYQPNSLVPVNTIDVQLVLMLCFVFSFEVASSLSSLPLCSLVSFAVLPLLKDARGKGGTSFCQGSVTGRKGRGTQGVERQPGGHQSFVSAAAPGDLLVGVEQAPHVVAGGLAADICRDALSFRALPEPPLEQRQGWVEQRTQAGGVVRRVQKRLNLL